LDQFFPLLSRLVRRQYQCDSLNGHGGSPRIHQARVDERLAERGRFSEVNLLLSRNYREERVHVLLSNGRIETHVEAGHVQFLRINGRGHSAGAGRDGTICIRETVRDCRYARLLLHADDSRR
jgi:hypothetical protein